MTQERFEEICEETESDWNGDNLFQGCLILAKYIDYKTKDIIGAAEHDIVYGPDIEEIVEAGITEEDTVALFKLNWMIDGEFGCLACFV